MSCKNTEAWNFSRALTQNGLNILVIISIGVAKALQYVKNRSSHWDVFCKFFLNKFTFNTVTFQVFFQEFYLDFKLLLLLYFRFPRGYIFQNTFFWKKNGTTWQLTRWETVVLLILLTFLGCLRLPESSIKIWDRMLRGKLKSLNQQFAVSLFQAWSLKFKSVLIFYEKFK